mmetsp:Transcript_27767/g.55519  ORF Transcript_27767/g.55519 Transcript_27767/m.55519 type:complete len:202 (+) Transcript_27767:25-630(+)
MANFVHNGATRRRFNLCLGARDRSKRAAPAPASSFTATHGGGRSLHLAEGVAATIQALHRAHVLHAVLARAGDHGDEGQERRVQETLSGAFRGTAQVGHHEPTTAKHRTAPLLLRHVAPQFRRAHLGDAVAPPRDALVRRRAAWRSDGLLGGNVGSGPDDRRIAVADLGAPGEQGHSVVVAPLAGRWRRDEVVEAVAVIHP